MQIFDVFISYRRADGAKNAELVCEYLRNMGLRVFLDNKGGIEDGHPFDIQIKKQLIATPHYVLIGSKEAFRFREGEDWVREEITLAVEHYRELGNRTITILLPEGMDIPPKDTLPEELQKLLKFQIIPMAEPKALERVLTAVTAVNHANLWHASHRWLENEKQPGGRFCNLQVDESLLPSAALELPSNVVDGDCGIYDLLETVNCETRHIYLYGQGGMGKTTSLLKLMNEAYEGKAYDEASVVPLFVELSAAPDTPGRLYQGGTSSFIRRSIYRQIRNDKSVKQVREAAVEELDSVFTQPYETVVAPLDQLLSQDSPNPQYLLLLDGLNELSTVQIEEDGPTVAQMVQEEIRYLARNCSNVRLVLTGRSRERSLEEENFLPLELAGVSEYVIYQYLARKNCDLNRNQDLLEILQIPLFLIMYAELSAKDGICTQGEILHRFFAHRKTGEYTMLSHTEDMVRSIKKSASATSKNRIDPQLHRFLLDFVLPEIGWYMEQKEMFHIPGRYLYDIIWSVLANRGDTDICGMYGMDAFYPDVTTPALADKLMQRLGKDPRQVCEGVVNLLAFTMGVLKRTERGYAFTHQHIRDYFAARKYINALKLGSYMHQMDGQAAWEYMESVFGGRPLDLVVCRFIGEILREHRNLPTEEENGWVLPELTAEQALLTNALDIYKDRFPGGKGIVALMEILKTGRKNLAGCDLSRLDLTACRLSGTPLRLGDLEADFTQSLLRGETLIHAGHTGYVNTVNYGPDGSYVLTGGSDGKVISCDAATGACKQLAQMAGPVWYARILSEGVLLTVCESRQRNALIYSCEKLLIARTDLQTGEVEKQLELPGDAFDIRLSADEKLLLIQQWDTLQVVDSQTLEILQQHTLCERDYISVFLGKTYEVLLSDGSTVHALTGERRQLLPLREKKDAITHAAVHGAVLCTVTEEAKNVVRLEIYRLKDGKLLKSFLQDWRSASRFDVNIPDHNAKKCWNLVFSDQGKWLAMVTPNDVFLYETSTWQLKGSLQNMMGEYINAVAFCDGSHRMAAGTLNGGVYLCETTNFSPVVYAHGIPCRFRQMTIAPDGTHMLTLSADGMLRYWDLQTGKLAGMRFVGRQPSLFISITQDGQFARVRDRDFQYYLLPDLQPFSGLRLQPGYSLVSEESGEYLLHIHKDGVRQYTVCGREGRIAGPYLLVKGWADGYFRACYDLETGLPLWGHSKVDPFSFVACSDRFLVLSHGNCYEAYEIATGELLGQMENDNVGFIKFIHGDCIYAHEGITDAHFTRIYRLPDFQLVAELPGHIFFSEDGKWVQVEDVTEYGEAQFDIYRSADRTQVASFTIIGHEFMAGDSRGHVYVPVVKNRFAVCRSEETVCVYELTEDSSCEYRLLGEYTIVPGLDVMSVDLSDLHPDSTITPQQEELLRTYGAII